MKLIIGFIAGCFVGGFWVSNSTEQQRQRARDAAVGAGRRVKESRVGKAVDDNASKVAATAGERVADAVDTTADTLVDKLEGSEQHATN
jgi:hypothetical protein